MENMGQLSRNAVAEYLPVVKSIRASIEVEMAHTDLDKISILRLPQTHKQYGDSTTAYALMLIGGWLTDTQFTTNLSMIHKKTKEAKWVDLLAILNKHILEYENEAPIIPLALYRSGRIVRTIDEITLDHNFESDGIKKGIVLVLNEHRGYVGSDVLKQRTGSKSIQSVAKMIATINRVLRAKLQLHKDNDFIESKRGSGYRLNSIYNVVVEK